MNCAIDHLINRMETNNIKPISVIVFIDWFYPAYKAGGPIKSISNMVESLKDNLQFTIVTSNRDIDASIIDVPVNVRVQKDGFNIVYTSNSFQNSKGLRQLYKEIKPDILYYNSPFSYKFTLLPYIVFRNYSNLKHVIAPRGMLSENCLAQKRFKKKVFLYLANMFLFNNNILWHATSSIEEEEIFRNIKNQPKTRIATNLSITINEHVKVPEKNKGLLKLIFLSRIHVVKNLLFILKILDRNKKMSGLTLDIYGPIEQESYWEECRVLVNKNSNISYKRELKPNEVKDVICNYHFLVLPTKNENYGHVITEFISSGIPVIISDNTPWLNLEKEGVGYSLSLEKEIKWIEALQNLIGLGNEQYQIMSENCKNYAKKNIIDEHKIQDNLSLFTNGEN